MSDRKAISFSISYGSVLIFSLASNSLSKQWGGWQQKAIIEKASSQLSKQFCVFPSQIVYKSISVFDIQSVWNGALSGVCVCVWDMHWASWLIFQGMISPLTSKEGYRNHLEGISCTSQSLYRKGPLEGRTHQQTTGGQTPGSCFHCDVRRFSYHPTV